MPSANRQAANRKVPAFQALRDDGYEKLSIVRVAAAAGVHETSIYRRWGGKGALLMDVCLSKAADAIPAAFSRTSINLWARWFEY
jgi:AcrR family transcriptional regulator